MYLTASEALGREKNKITHKLDTFKSVNKIHEYQISNELVSPSGANE
jgi:hypothetical protein